MYFEDTGELWILHGSAVFETKAHKLLSVDKIFEGWAAALRRAMWMFDYHGAFSARRVEVGLAGLDSLLDEEPDEAGEPVVRVVDEQVMAHLALANAHWVRHLDVVIPRSPT